MLLNAEALGIRFQKYATEAAKFSREISGITVSSKTERSRIADLNLEIAKTVFGKWCIETLVIMYDRGPMGFEELRRALGAVSPRVLSRKLIMMQRQGLAVRGVVDSRPPGVRYSLTEKGLTLCRIGEPLFLFLGLAAPRD